MPPMQLVGRVSKAGKMVKTVTVTVERLVTHFPTYKRLKRSKNYLVHDETNTLRVDDVVLFRNCPPISKLKRFTLEKVLKSPEGELESRRAAEARQAELDGVDAPMWTTTPLLGRTPALPRWTAEQFEKMKFRERRLLEAQGKAKLPPHLTTYPEPAAPES